MNGDDENRFVWKTFVTRIDIGFKLDNQVFDKVRSKKDNCRRHGTNYIY